MLDEKSEHFIDTLNYVEVFESPVCWKLVSAVNKELKNLGSKSAKLRALKNDIRIRDIGLGWSDLASP